MRRVILLVLLIVPLLAARAEALTLRDIIELSKAGLSDDVLLALIEVDQTVFAIDRETIELLKAQGVSERVMIAMIKSGRTPPPAPSVVPAVQPPIEPAAAPPPQVVVIEHHEPERVREVAVPVPVYVPVVPRKHGRVVRTPERFVTPPSPYYSGQVRPAVPRTKAAEPVYWGFGGKLRPDAWQPTHPPSKSGKKDDGRK